MPSCSRIEKSGPVAHLILDDPSGDLNTLGAAMVAELSTQMGILKADGSVRAVVIRSGKSGGFLAGARPEELRALSASANPAEDGYRAARAGQALTNAVEDLGKPVVAAIHGPALGGGCELALACTARVAADKGVRIGLPEIQLGILPSFGGTWRLPRLATFARATPAIIQSKLFDAGLAAKIGLVDGGAPLEGLPAAAAALALRLAGPGAAAAFDRARWKRHARWHRLLNWGLLRNVALDRARSLVVARHQDRYPAPLRAIELMRNLMLDRDEYLDKEARAFGELLATEVSRNLVRLFLQGQEARTRRGPVPVVPVAHAAVVGTGFMGSGIALALVSKARLPTDLWDSEPAALELALKDAGERMRKAVADGRLGPAESDARFSLLRPGAGSEDLKRAEVVIEAVPDHLEAKQALFAELEGFISGNAVLASSTSALSINDIAAQALRPERVLGLHFFSPIGTIPLVEVVRGRRTSELSLARAADLAVAMGKTPVLVKDSPGFLVNRVLVPYILEAAQLVAEGVPPGKVEAAALDFGMSMGPLALIGEIRVSVVKPLIGVLKRDFSDHLPRPAWVDHADFGKAFKRDKNGKMHVDYDSISAWVARSTPDYPLADVQDRLYLALLNESVRALDEGLVESPGILDFAVVYGAGFPACKGGPLRLAELRGPAAWAARADTLAAKACWLKPPETLRVKNGFY